MLIAGPDLAQPVVDWLQSQGTVTPGNSNNGAGVLGPLKGLEGGLQLPDHWKQRWLGPLEDEQVEVGPLLGRGGYGRVYKGAPSDHACCLLHTCNP